MSAPPDALVGVLTPTAAARIGAEPGPVRYVLFEGHPLVARHVWTPDGTRIAGSVEIGPNGIAPEAGVTS